MLLRSAFSAVILILSLGQPAVAQAAVNLETSKLYQEALRALKGEQTDLAAQRFNEFLSTLKEDDPNRPTVLLRIGEAMVRSGDVEEALKRLADPSLAKLEEATFWSASAQAGLGRLKDAADTLGKLADSKDPRLKRVATLGRARLLASLGNLREADEILKTVDPGPGKKSDQEALLLRASVLMEESKFKEAATLLDSVDTVVPSLKKRKTYNLALIALATEEYENAHGHFTELTKSPSHFSTPIYRSVILGSSDALHKLDRDAEAIDQLLGYLNTQPHSQFIEPFFRRLMSLSAGNDALRSKVEARIIAWTGIDPENKGSLLRPTDNPFPGTLPQNAPLTRTNLTAYALYHRALLLTEKNNLESVVEARSVLNQLRLNHPNHPLSVQSLLETGRMFLAEKKPDQALTALAALSAVAKSPALKSLAAELTARVQFAQGDFDEASGAFAQARATLQTDDKSFTAINQGLALLQAEDGSAFEELMVSLKDSDAAPTLALEQALHLAANRDTKAGPLLDRFIRKNPTSPRIIEARLSFAEISVFVDPHNPEMAGVQLDSIDYGKLSQTFSLRHLLARLRHAELSGNWDPAIAEANSYLDIHDKETDPGIRLKLAEAYYRNGDFNRARIQFVQAAKNEQAPAQREVARFYAAKAGMREGTDQARSSAIELFEEVAKSDSLLATDARLQLARAHLDASNPEKSIEALEPLVKNTNAGQPHIDALILTTEAYRARGNTEDLENCLKVYDAILDQEDLAYPLNNRIHFLKGLTLEQLHQPAKALDSYYRVINGENLKEGEAISEWKWYYDCGFSALKLLKDGKRWRAAFGVGRTLQLSGGPRAKEAKEQAEDIQLRHMIWDKE